MSIMLIKSKLTFEYFSFIFSWLKNHKHQNQNKFKFQSEKEEKELGLEEDRDILLALELNFKQEQERQRRQKEQESAENEASQTHKEKEQNKEIESLQQSLAQKEQENIILKQEKEEFATGIISMQSEVETLRNERDSIQNQYELIQKDNQQLKQRLQHLNLEIDQLKDEHKQYELNMNELEKENERLKAQFINTDRYLSWNTDQLFLWITNLESGRFNRYKESLSKNLHEEGVCGKHLTEINVLHIKGWGITNFEDKQLLMKKIKELMDSTKNNPNEVALINDEEGAISGGYFK